MISSSVYQAIYDELNKYLLPDWEKLIVYLEYGEASYSFSFYVKTSAGYCKCFDLPGVSENELLDSFSAIDQFVSSERMKNGDDLWSNMTMVVNSSGDMKVDFDYTDLSVGAYQYSNEWKEKYLV